MTQRLLQLCFCYAWVFAWAGCSGAPTPPERPKINPAAAAQDAMSRYDANHDSTLDETELVSSPALKHMLDGIKRRDPSHADSLTADDIANRLKSWMDGTATVVDSFFTFSLDGAPLEGAAITFEPEPWLGPSYKKHKGLTDKMGVANLDPSLSGFPGIFIGLYSVKVSKLVEGNEIVPPWYNSKTILGLEICGDSPFGAQLHSFALKSKP